MPKLKHSLTGFQYNFLYTCPYSVVVAQESSLVAGLSTSPSIDR